MNSHKQKMSFDSKKEAEDTARIAALQHGTKLSPYLCKTCNLWHLSSKYS